MATVAERCNDAASKKTDHQVKLQDFEIFRHIGTGNFSDVFLVHRRVSSGDDAAVHPQRRSTAYAMKRMRKKSVKRLYKEREVFMEKQCLTKLHNVSLLPNETDRKNNIVRLYHTFQDAEFLYLILEYCSLGELWEIISGVGLLDEKVVLYYIAQLVNALEFCHNHGIVHRDLKAENLMVDEKGVLKLIDFGTALDLHRPDVKGAGNRSQGCGGRVYDHFVGTAHFMAPEAVKNQSTGRLSDLWSLGCTIYQILTGVPPFKAPSDFLVHLRSRQVDLDIPPDFPKEAEDLIRQLLRPLPYERLSSHDLPPFSTHSSAACNAVFFALAVSRTVCAHCASGLAGVKAHPYFANVDFDDLEHTLAPPQPPLPSLAHYCFGHMSKHWERFQPKWIDAGWLPSDGVTPPLLATGGPQPNDENANGAEQEAKPEEFNTGCITFWEKPSRPSQLEKHSQQLLLWKTALNCTFLQRARKRLLYYKRVEKERDEAFWDTRVKEFLDEKKNRATLF